MKLILDTEISKKRLVFTAPVITAIITNPNSYSTHVTLLELMGDLSSMRAIWAHIVKHRMDKEYVKTDVTLETNTGDRIPLYIWANEKFIQNTIAGHLFLYSKNYDKTTRRYFIGGDFETAPEDFLDAFRINVVDVPILPEWQHKLWKSALEHSAIIPQDVYSNSSINAWTIKSGFNWKEFVQKEVSSWQD